MLNGSQRQLLKLMMSFLGLPAEQVDEGRQSCASVVENCTPLPAGEFARQVGAGVGVSVWKVEMVVGGRQVQQQFRLESRPMPWGGGIKFYFYCGCGRRCAKLYLPPGGDQFACRSCHRLLYWDQRFKPRQIA